MHIDKKELIAQVVWAQSTIDTVARVEITHNKMLDAVEANGWVREHIQVLACSVQVGARAFTAPVTRLT